MKKCILPFILTVVLFISALPVAALTFDDPEIIKQVQQALNEKGFDCGTPDGSAGPATQAAIEQYYSNKNISGAIAVDLTLVLSLGIETTIPILDDYDFVVCTEEERTEIASTSWENMRSKIDEIAGSIGVKDGYIGSLGNYRKLPNGFIADSLYTADDKWLIVNCICGTDSSYCEVELIRDADSGLYYYLGPAYEGEYDVNDYLTGELLTKADEWTPSMEPELDTTNEIKEEIESTTRKIIADEIHDTSITSIDVNQNTEGNYLVLPHLVWNVKNPKDLTEKMLERYSLTLAKFLSDEHGDVLDEICIFWSVPYISESDQCKYQYFKNSTGTWVVGDTVIGWK